MTDLINKVSSLPSVVAEDSEQMIPDTIYLIPPGKAMMVGEGRLLVSDTFPSAGPNYPIDIFFRSLAADQPGRTIGIILSGTGSDGSRGIVSIKEEGGLVIVQDPEQSKFDGMPISAISSDVVDVVCDTQVMYEKVRNFIDHPYNFPDKNIAFQLSNTDAYTRIIELLTQETDIDFSMYKPQTIERRISRRMGINEIKYISSYLDLLLESPVELGALGKDLLIGVTRFFRDDAFDVLERDIIPKLFETLPDDGVMRIWSAGCSTGEEALSIAMLCDEYCQRVGRKCNVKIFATDVDPYAIELASAARFVPSVADDVGEERFQRYFKQVDDQTYTVIPRIRKMVIFAVHNLLSDPPFSSAHLVVCRNVLIYMRKETQNRILTLFQFSLKLNGYLFLGTSETISEHGLACKLVDEKARIYRKVAEKGSSMVSTKPSSRLGPRENSFKPSLKHIMKSYEDDNSGSIRSINGLILEDLLPPAILVSEDGKVLHYYGAIDQYTVRPIRGEPSSQVLDCIVDDLAIPMSQAMSQAKSSAREVLITDVPVLINQVHKHVDLRVKHYGLSELGPKYYLALILDPVKAAGIDVKSTEDVGVKSTYDAEQAGQDRIRELEREIRHMSSNLQLTIEERETANEELQSSNEELLAANEELQSTNEELQSVNEELYTVNSEYQEKIQEVIRSNANLDTLVNNLDVGIIFLDKHFTIQKYNPESINYIGLIETDIGRPFHQIAYHFEYSNLLSDIAEAMMDDKQISKTVEIKPDAKADAGMLEVKLIPASGMSEPLDKHEIHSGCIVSLRRV